ncbi:NUDIX domain-containing protein [Rhodobacterales bacterium HKCCE4037]|nr:NUDIX domain-containing protein [Rhodobacterales bacterium HKCCE4037]
MPRPIRLAVRGLLLIENRLLLVNAWPGGVSDLLCPPGGGAEPHSSLEDNLKREFYEETGLGIAVGAPCLVNEFHDPDRDFHQVDVYFRVSLVSGQPLQPWVDTEGVVTEHHLVTREEMAGLRYKPDSLPDIAWSDRVFYDPLEPVLR